MILSFTRVLLPQYQDKVDNQSQPRFFRRDTAHVLASDQGRQAACAGRQRLIVCGCLGNRHGNSKEPTMKWVA